MKFYFLSLQRLKCVGLWRSTVNNQWNSIEQISLMDRTMKSNSRLQEVKISRNYWFFFFGFYFSKCLFFLGLLRNIAIDVMLCLEYENPTASLNCRHSSKDPQNKRQSYVKMHLNGNSNFTLNVGLINVHELFGNNWNEKPMLIWSNCRANNRVNFTLHGILIRKMWTLCSRVLSKMQSKTNNPFKSFIRIWLMLKCCVGWIH